MLMSWGWMARVGVVATNLRGSFGKKLAKKAPRCRRAVGGGVEGGGRMEDCSRHIHWCDEL